jgi:hypothetical protein
VLNESECREESEPIAGAVRKRNTAAARGDTRRGRGGLGRPPPRYYRARFKPTPAGAEPLRAWGDTPAAIAAAAKAAAARCSSKAATGAAGAGAAEEAPAEEAEGPREPSSRRILFAPRGLEELPAEAAAAAAGAARGTAAAEGLPAARDGARSGGGGSGAAADGSGALEEAEGPWEAPLRRLVLAPRRPDE